LVTDQGEGDPVGAVGHRAGDNAALLATGAQPGGALFRGRVVQPQAQAEIDQRAAQLDAAFAADREVAAFAGGLVLDRVEPGGAVELLGSGPTAGIADGGGVVPGPHRPPTRDGGQGPERAQWQ